jgi:transporter family protein
MAYSGLYGCSGCSLTFFDPAEWHGAAAKGTEPPETLISASTQGLSAPVEATPQRCTETALQQALPKLGHSAAMASSMSWLYWAVLSAVFAALTAIFAKIGIQGVDSDLATLVRTAIIIGVLFAFVWFTGKWTNPFTLSGKTWLFLGLSGLATGASWVCYFRALQIGEASKVAPVDKLSLVLVAVFAFAFLGERPNAREWLGIAMVAGGVLVLAVKR